jgi:pentatricopeptide repeat protein
MQFTTIMNAAAEQGDYEFIQIMIEVAENKGLWVDVHMNTLLMKALIRAGKVEDALELLQDMRHAEDESSRPNVMTYCIAISSLKDGKHLTYQVEQWLDDDGLADEISTEWATLMSTRQLHKAIKN